MALRRLVAAGLRTARTATSCALPPLAQHALWLPSAVLLPRLFGTLLPDSAGAWASRRLRAECRLGSLCFAAQPAAQTASLHTSACSSANKVGKVKKKPMQLGGAFFPRNA